MVAKRMKALLVNKLLMRSCFSKKVSQMYLYCKKCEVTFSISITRVVTKVIIFFVKNKLLFLRIFANFWPIVRIIFLGEHALLLGKLYCKLHTIYQKQTTILQIFANFWSFVRITLLGEARNTFSKIIL